MSYIIPFETIRANGGGGNMAKNKKQKSRSVFIETIPAGIGFTARYAYPGSETTYVGTNRGHLVFTQDDADKLTAADAAELAAYRSMNADWNRHLDTKTESTNYFGTKPSAEWLKEVVDDLWLDTTSLATLCATRDERVADWIAGNESAPFFLYWALSFLRKEGALEEAFAAIRPHLSQTPDYREFRNRMATFDALRDKVEGAINEQREIADIWENENGGTHRMRDVINFFDEVADPNSELSLNARYKRLEEIAGRIGVAFDVNAEIQKQNEPYYREITRKRVDRMSKERKIVKEIEKTRSQRLKEERAALAAKEERENRMKRLGLKRS